jgi:hypothetical protein
MAKWVLDKKKIFFRYAYLTYDDIKNLSKFSKDEDDVFLIIKAPKGTTLG